MSKPKQEWPVILCNRYISMEPHPGNVDHILVSEYFDVDRFVQQTDNGDLIGTNISGPRPREVWSPVLVANKLIINIGNN